MIPIKLVMPSPTNLQNPVPAKNLKGFTTYLKPEAYNALKRIAETEDRSVSNLAARILTDWVKTHEATEGKNNATEIN